MSRRDPAGFTVGVDLGAPGVSIGCRQRGRTDVFAVGAAGGWHTDPAGVPDATTDPDAARQRLHSLLSAVGTPSRTRCVVLAHPVDWTVSRVAATVGAARAAGAGRVVAAPRPTAAAVAHEHEAGDVVVVYDLEPDRFCATVLRRRSRGWETLGEPQIVPTASGHALDVAVLRLLDQRSGGLVRRLAGTDPWAEEVPPSTAGVREACVSARRALARRPDEPVELPTGAGGGVLLDRAGLDVALRPVFLETIGAVRRSLRTASVGRTELGGVILVGEAADDPLATRLLGEVLACPVLVGLEPEHTVARGAARLAELVVERSDDDPRTAGAVHRARTIDDDGREDDPARHDEVAGPAGRPGRRARRRWAVAAAAVVVGGIAAVSATDASGLVGRLGLDDDAPTEVRGVAVTPSASPCTRADSPAVCIDEVALLRSDTGGAAGEATDGPEDELAVRYSRSVAPHRLPLDGYPVFHLDGIDPPAKLDPTAPPPSGIRRASADPTVEWFGGPDGRAPDADPPFTVADLGPAARRLCVAVYDGDDRLVPDSDECHVLPERVLDALAATTSGD
ncbi:MAG: Hsp70 family protein [Actinomycetota bacterium]|nr:Hsp70 family protein [Actinomycetota bacterium]